jgi:hypothetical protein
MEIKQLFVFPRCCLTGNKMTMAKSGTHAEVLEGTCAGEDNGWIRPCAHLGEAAGAPKENLLQDAAWSSRA